MNRDGSAKETRGFEESGLFLGFFGALLDGSLAEELRAD